MAASESIYSPTVYRDFLSTLFVQTVLHKDMQWETGTHNGEVCVTAVHLPLSEFMYINRVQTSINHTQKRSNYEQSLV